MNARFRMWRLALVYLAIAIILTMAAPITLPQPAEAPAVPTVTGYSIAVGVLPSPTP